MIDAAQIAAEQQVSCYSAAISFWSICLLSESFHTGSRKINKKSAVNQSVLLFTLQATESLPYMIRIRPHALFRHITQHILCYLIHQYVSHTVPDSSPESLLSRQPSISISSIITAISLSCSSRFHADLICSTMTMYSFWLIPGARTKN